MAGGAAGGVGRRLERTGTGGETPSGVAPNVSDSARPATQPRLLPLHETVSPPLDRIGSVWKGPRNPSRSTGETTYHERPTHEPRDLLLLLLTVVAFTTIAVLAARKEGGFVLTVGRSDSHPVPMEAAGIADAVPHSDRHHDTAGSQDRTLEPEAYGTPTGMWLLLTGVGPAFQKRTTY